MSTFPRARRSQPGYDIEQVEDFLEDARRAYATDARAATAIDSSTIRRTSFTMQKGGYSPAHVDAALERLEEAFARREHERGIVEHGEEPWYAKVRARAKDALEQLRLPDGERFRRVSRISRGYRLAEVDRFAARIAEYLQDGPDMTAREVRTVQFDAQFGGYDEDEVDALLDTVVSLMLAVR
ncbi:DivIVA domain-containing protein [Agrococcus sp. ARC_14]|uniref:DivIVA domain-containing protein n=1 Tax=Agrococcus sp. ARC_14 TaxID=2919927 RepID=UPI001F067A8B|nr:DivIVA domain-containing protein [Agrococcus sp. ARC_14]MCH1882776.1 DivIVA domain-containing protein [Agrococcus sp. ARC_14]